MPGSHSQDRLNDIRPPPAAPSGPVRVVTTGGNVPTQPVSRPVRLLPTGRSPKTQRRSAEFAAQLTGKGVPGEGSRTGQGPSPAGSPSLNDERSRKLGGSLFYITAVNNNSPSSPETANADPSNRLQRATLNDNWELSKKDSPPTKKISTPNAVATTPDQELPAARPEIQDLSEDTFKEVATPNERPAIVSYYILQSLGSRPIGFSKIP